MLDRTSSNLLAAPVGPLRIDPGHHSLLDLSLIVPTFNEAANIRPFLAAVQRTLDPLLQHRYEVVVVDDDSPDRTWELAAGVSSSFPQLRIVRRTGERELSSAVLRGWQVARAPILGTINADFQHPPSLLGDMLNRIPDSDLVVASRFGPTAGLQDWTLHRLLVAQVARQIGRGYVPSVFARVSDPLSGCFLVRRRAIEGIEFSPTGFKTLIELLARTRIQTVQECGYRMQPRRNGHSKLTVRNCLRYLDHLHRLRRATRSEELLGSPSR